MRQFCLWGVRLEGGGAARGGLDDDACVFGEVDLLTVGYPAVVEGAGCTVVADAGDGVGRASCEADDGAGQAEARGSADSVIAQTVAGAGTVVCVVVEGAAGQEGEEDGQADLVLRFGLGLALGVERDVSWGVGTGEPGLDGTGFGVRNLKLAEAEGENAGAAELPRGLGAGDGADQRGGLGDGGGVVGIEDGLGDGSFDGLADGGGLGAKRLVEIGLDNPTAGVGSGGVGERTRLLPEVTL